MSAKAGVAAVAVLVQVPVDGSVGAGAGMDDTQRVRWIRGKSTGVGGRTGTSSGEGAGIRRGVLS